MGHHYIPKYYLSGFTSGTTIWAHDRLERRSFASQPKSVANETDMYPNGVEEYLGSSVEDPAKNAIEKIRQFQEITELDRKAIARYIVSLWKRVPAGRERVAALIPEVAVSVRNDIHAELTKAALSYPHLADRAEARKVEIDQVIEKYKVDKPSKIWNQSLAKEETEDLHEILLSMNWRFLHTENKQLLTSDNPVFFFRQEGIGAPNSELTLPFSSNVALWANRNPSNTSAYLQAAPAAIRELNRRVVSNATRFVYSAKDERWILPFVCKMEHNLTRLI